MPAALQDGQRSQQSPSDIESLTFFPFPRQRNGDTVDTPIDRGQPDPPVPIAPVGSARALPSGPSHDPEPPGLPTPLGQKASWTLKNLDYLYEAWPLLIELRIPGTRPRWTERSHRILGAPGENAQPLQRSGKAAPSAQSTGSSGAAPTNVSLLDLLASLAYLADDIAHALADVLGSSEAATLPSAWLDPRPHFAFAKTAAMGADALDPRTIPWLFEQLTPLVIQVSAILGEARHGQVLAALCPWCGGRTAASPIGGSRTLVLRRPDPLDPDLASALIVCTGINCSPPASSCAHRDPHGRPAWPWREWDWLATQLLPLPGAQKTAAGPPSEKGDPTATTHRLGTSH